MSSFYQLTSWKFQLIEKRKSNYLREFSCGFRMSHCLFMLSHTSLTISRSGLSGSYTIIRVAVTPQNEFNQTPHWWYSANIFAEDWMCQKAHICSLYTFTHMNSHFWEDWYQQEWLTLQFAHALWQYVSPGSKKQEPGIHRITVFFPSLENMWRRYSHTPRLVPQDSTRFSL